jgi:microcystin-dependent protein
VTGAAGTYDIYATTGSNVFTTNPAPPPPENDTTTYTFALASVAHGATPAATHYRKLGEAVFDGTRITLLRQTLGYPDGVQIFQPGDLKVSAAATAPPGWLVCQGQNLLRTDYPALFAAIGVAYGSVDGTHFNIPDYQGRTILGAGAGSGLTLRSRGTKYGNENHSHSVAGLSVPGLQIPDLGLFASADDHSHGLGAGGVQMTLVGGNKIAVGGLGGGTYSASQALVGSNTVGEPFAHSSIGLNGTTDGTPGGTHVTGVAVGDSVLMGRGGARVLTAGGTTGGGTAASAADNSIPPSTAANVWIKT